MKNIVKRFGEIAHAYRKITQIYLNIFYIAFFLKIISFLLYFVLFLTTISFPFHIILFLKIISFSSYSILFHKIIPLYNSLLFEL